MEVGASLPPVGPVLVIDNYDSFTFNLVHALEALTTARIQVMQRDEVKPERLQDYSAFVFSPGPGLPQESPALMQLVAAAVQLGKPVLGVCLGHQALAIYAGAQLRNLAQVHHGVAHSLRVVDGMCPLFAGLTAKIDAGRYHSWVVEPKSLPADWKVTCVDSEGEIMAMRHTSKPLFGIQFHPESIMTPDGRALLANFLKIAGYDVDGGVNVSSPKLSA